MKNLSWKELKEKIKSYSKDQAQDIAFKLYNDFDINEDELLVYLESDNKIIRDAAKWHLDILKDWVIRKDYNGVISIKLIIPTFCNYHCSFCCLKNYPALEHDKEIFLNRFIKSLGEIVFPLMKKNLPISLDITGNEPTFDPEFLKEIMSKLRLFPYLTYIKRIVLTTNGYKIKECTKYLKNVVDYVNISVHHYDLEKRKAIFNSENVLTSIDYQEAISELLRNDIKTSCTAVLSDKIDNFMEYFYNFVNFSKEIGFASLRFRANTLSLDSKKYFSTYMKQIKESGLNLIDEYITKDCHWMRVSDDSGFFIYFLNAIEDIRYLTRGLEYVVHDDGLAYMDHFKTIKFEDYDLPYDVIFDKK